MTTRYGFIGLGNLGAALAASLRRAGFDLCVHDIDRKAAKALLAQGAVWSESPRALARPSTRRSPVSPPRPSPSGC